jgi:hypothetical protein
LNILIAPALGWRSIIQQALSRKVNCFSFGFNMTEERYIFFHIVRSLYSERGDRFFMLPKLNQQVLSPNKPQTNAQFKDPYCCVAANPQIYT